MSGSRITGEFFDDLIRQADKKWLNEWAALMWQGGKVGKYVTVSPEVEKDGEHARQLEKWFDWVFQLAADKMREELERDMDRDEARRKIADKLLKANQRVIEAISVAMKHGVKIQMNTVNMYTIAEHLAEMAQRYERPEPPLALHKGLSVEGGVPDLETSPITKEEA